MSAAEQASWHRGDWMQTYTGRRFWPLAPRAEEIDIRDIAHALSLLCRYNGHVDRFYSVAEHCVHMSRHIAPEHALWALLHDATEAYVGDMIRPLKVNMPDYRVAEDRVMAAIAEAFGIDPAMPREVKEIDSRILLNERAELMSATRHSWNLDLEAMGPIPGLVVEGWSPERAEDEYLARFAEVSR